MTIRYADTSVEYDSAEFGWTKKGLAWSASKNVKQRPMGNPTQVGNTSYFLHELNDERTSQKYHKVKGGKYCQDEEGNGYKEGEGPFMKYETKSRHLNATVANGGLGHTKWNNKKACEGGVWKGVCYIEAGVSREVCDNMTDPYCGTRGNPSARFELIRKKL